MPTLAVEIFPPVVGVVELSHGILVLTSFSVIIDVAITIFKMKGVDPHTTGRDTASCCSWDDPAGKGSWATLTGAWEKTCAEVKIRRYCFFVAATTVFHSHRLLVVAGVNHKLLIREYPRGVVLEGLVLEIGDFAGTANAALNMTGLAERFSCLSDFLFEVIL